MKCAFFTLKNTICSLLFPLVILILPSVHSAQSNELNETNKEFFHNKVRVFLDCDECDFEYISKEISFVDFVRDPQTAQVHIIISHQHTASQGKQYNLSFIGRENFNGQNNSLVFDSYAADSEDTIREGIAGKIKIGLMIYISQTEIADLIEIIYSGQDTDQIEKETYDSWDYWVFNINLTGGLEAEENQKSYSVTGELEARRITENWKIKNDFSYDFEEEVFDDDDEKIISTLREWELNSSAVKSISDHWSIGLFGELHSTTFRNIDLRMDIAPAVEYNFFPWYESSKWLLAVAYSVGLKDYQYLEETIFNKTHETLWFHAATIEMDMVQQWGSIDSEIEVMHLIELENKYSINVNLGLNLRVMEGLSLRLALESESIHNQIYLPKGDASLEEILLKRKQLETTYDINLEIGIRYTFGSIYNNVVNRRL
ncbi:DUF481 domain-containing protein [Bacteroidota bacterium]